jgi:hypothetical protein
VQDVSSYLFIANRELALRFIVALAELQQLLYVDDIQHALAKLCVAFCVFVSRVDFRVIGEWC